MVRPVLLPSSLTRQTPWASSLYIVCTRYSTPSVSPPIVDGQFWREKIPGNYQFWVHADGLFGDVILCVDDVLRDSAVVDVTSTVAPPLGHLVHVIFPPNSD